MKNIDSRTEPSVLTTPQTLPTRYISGIAALNILSDEGTGDWHAQAIFHLPRRKAPRSFLAGEGTGTNTLPLLGTDGIYDCAETLDGMHVDHPHGPVYAANHARATAD